MEIIALQEGSYSVDSLKEFIPFDSMIHQAKDRPASSFLNIQPFLIKTTHQLILLDTGLGNKTETGELILHKNIRHAGFDPNDVDLVLLSHLHFDHAGGMFFEQDDEVKATFENAHYVIQGKELETALSKPTASYKMASLKPLLKHDSVQLVDGTGQLNATIRYELTGGHCQFHQIYLIQDENETVFFGADILPDPTQLFKKMIAKYDFDGRKAMELREEYTERAIKGGWICLFYHAKSKPISKIVR